MEGLSCLDKIGFSANEAKIYTTLLKHKLLNGYEIAKFSGVARSSVYDVINRMVGKGTILKVDGEPNYYRPLAYDRLLDKIRSENERCVKAAEEVFKKADSKDVQGDYVLNIVGYDKFMAKARELIDEASQELSLSVWRSEFELLSEALGRAVARGVRVYLFSFESISQEGAVVFSYRISDVQNLFPYRRTALIADNCRVLLGESSRDSGVFTYTRNHSVVSLATDEMVLNIFWYRYMERRALLRECNTSADFLCIMDRLAGELGIDENMTKNMMVFNYQRGEHANVCKEHGETAGQGSNGACTP